MFPIKYPDLFNGKIKPWQGVLLYGPPGTGNNISNQFFYKKYNNFYYKQINRQDNAGKGRCHRVQRHVFQHNVKHVDQQVARRLGEVRSRVVRFGQTLRASHYFHRRGGLDGVRAWGNNSLEVRASSKISC